MQDVKLFYIYIVIMETWIHHKNNCQKILPAQSMITKRDFILRGSRFCEKYRFDAVKRVLLDIGHWVVCYSYTFRL